MGGGIIAFIFFLAVALPAQAASPLPFARDGKTPIDITADQLELHQSENKAIFSGKVVAVQGDVRLAAEKMTVHYRQKEGEDRVSGDAAAQNAIRRIEVERNVFLTTPQETASGDAGTYDVTEDRITLLHNVVLTKDKNTLKGEHLVYDLKTGKSTITSGSSPSQPGETGKKRVRALFIPENNDTVTGDAPEKQKQ